MRPDSFSLLFYPVVGNISCLLISGLSVLAAVEERKSACWKTLHTNSSHASQKI